MMTLSTTTSYAIQALTSLAAPDFPRAMIADIARRAGVPAAYLAKIMKRLNDAGIVDSKRGSKGGIWLAGAGVKGGIAHGRTDEFAFSTVENPVHVRDLTTTLCHLLGIDANRLSKRVLGVDLKPFGVEPGKVVREILA